MVHPSRHAAIVLAGGGHAHLEALHYWRQWGLRPPGEVVLIEPEPEVIYSGMIPGWIACQYDWKSLAVGVPELAESHGVRWVQEKFESWKPGEVKLQTGEIIPARVLSLNLGSRPSCPPWAPFDDLTFAYSRPLSRLPAVVAFWDFLLKGGGRLAVVGSGAAAVECALCFQRRWHGADVHLFAKDLPPVWKRDLERKGIAINIGRHEEWEKAGDGWGTKGAGRFRALFWATGPAADPLWLKSGIPTKGGYFSVNSSLEVKDATSNGTAVFAAGDCAALSFPKAGLYAVGQGKVLARNVYAAAMGEPLRYAYSRSLPPLQILNHGDGSARGHWGSWLTWKSRAIFGWKEWLDRRFLARHQKQ